MGKLICIVGGMVRVMFAICGAVVADVVVAAAAVVAHVEGKFIISKLGLML
jgi:hypothetical protein